MEVNPGRNGPPLLKFYRSMGSTGCPLGFNLPIRWSWSAWAAAIPYAR